MWRWGYEFGTRLAGAENIRQHVAQDPFREIRTEPKTLKYAGQRFEPNRRIREAGPYLPDPVGHQITVRTTFIGPFLGDRTAGDLVQTQAADHARIADGRP